MSNLNLDALAAEKLAKIHARPFLFLISDGWCPRCGRNSVVFEASILRCSTYDDRTWHLPQNPDLAKFVEPGPREPCGWWHDRSPEIERQVVLMPHGPGRHWWQMEKPHLDRCVYPGCGAAKTISASRGD